MICRVCKESKDEENFPRKKKRPDGSIFMELPEVPFNASEEATKPVEEQRVIDPETGYFGKKIEQLNQG